MKQKMLLFTLTAGMAIVILSSSDNGAAKNDSGDKTGRLGSTVTCRGCHGGNTGTTTCAIEVRKKSNPTGAIVTNFNTDSVYIVKLIGTNPLLSHFGFQLIAVNAPGGNVNVGAWQNLPSGTQSIANASTNNLTLIEHDAPLAKNGSGNYEVNLEWKAPSSNSVTFHGIINGVNNAGDTSGDRTSTPVQLTLQKSLTVNNTALNNDVTVYPNPATTFIKINAKNVVNGDINIAISDMRGKIIATQTTTVSGNELNAEISSVKWAVGLYYIHIFRNEEHKIIAVVKQ